MQWRDPLPFSGRSGWHCYLFDHRFDKLVGHHEMAAEKACFAFTRLALALQPHENERFVSLMSALRAGPSADCQALIRRRDTFQKACLRYGGRDGDYDPTPLWNGTGFDVIYLEEEECEQRQMGRYDSDDTDWW